MQVEARIDCYYIHDGSNSSETVQLLLATQRNLKMVQRLIKVLNLLEDATKVVVSQSKQLCLQHTVACPFKLSKRLVKKVQ